jgi:hypothetical protein
MKTVVHKGLLSLFCIQNYGNGFLNRVSGVRISPGPPLFRIQIRPSHTYKIRRVHRSGSNAGSNAV